MGKRLRVLEVVVWGFAFGATAFGLVFWIDALDDSWIGNLTPPVALLLGVLGGMVGAVVDIVVQASAPNWSRWQVALAPAATLVVLALAMLRLSPVWPRNDGDYLAHRLFAAQRQLDRSEDTEAIVLFHPPERGGSYEILIAGDQTPVWIIERPYERVWVQYPKSCGRIEADSPKPYSERTSLEMSSAPKCGGFAWGAGWSFFASSALNVPVTLKVEKPAGERTEIVLRKRKGTRIAEVVELASANPLGPEDLPTSVQKCVPSPVQPEADSVLDNGRSDNADDIVWDFRWTECPQSSRYHLYVIRRGAKYPVINNEGLTGTSYRHLSEGAYIIELHRHAWSWKVRARKGSRWSEWSEERGFDVEPVNSDPPAP